MKQATGRGRPRDAEIDRKILDAARTLLAEGGYRALAFDSISQMTDIPRSMIYRRWPTKAHLANEISTGGDDGLPDVIDAEGLDAQVLALVHQVFDRYRRPDIAAAAIGLEWVVAAVPRLPGLTLPITEEKFRAATQRITADDIKAAAARFNRFGEMAKAAGMRFAYHNHGFDFRRYDGRYGLDLILAETDPALVGLELDIGNTIAAGADPLPYLAPGGRVRLAHVKDWRGPYTPSLYEIPASAPVGEGTIAWPPILAALKRARVPYVFIEQEGINQADALDLLARNWRYLQGEGK